MSIQPKLIHNQRRIGLTGGIASGKSTITNYIKKHKQLPILDADKYSRELIAPNSFSYKEIVTYFGQKIIDKSSLKHELNRALLKKLILEDIKHREWIQKLLHPLIKEKMIKKCNQLENNKILLLVIPLLFEAKFTDICTEIWLVQCPKKTQINRLMKRDNINEKEAEKMINIQLDFEEKSKFSNVILDNSDNQKIWIDQMKKLF